MARRMIENRKIHVFKFLLACLTVLQRKHGIATHASIWRKLRMCVSIHPVLSVRGCIILSFRRCKTKTHICNGICVVALIVWDTYMEETPFVFFKCCSFLSARSHISQGFQHFQTQCSTDLYEDEKIWPHKFVTIEGRKASKRFVVVKGNVQVYLVDRLNYCPFLHFVAWGCVQLNLCSTSTFREEYLFTVSVCWKYTILKTQKSNFRVL